MHRRTRVWHSSKKCWAFANAPYAAGRLPPESGVWSVWPSISNDCMCCVPTERRVSWLAARKTRDGPYPDDPNAQPLSERVAHACPMSRADPCRIFLSDRLLAWHDICKTPISSSGAACFGKGRKAPQITEDHGDFPPVLSRGVAARGKQQLRKLGGEEAFETSNTFDLSDLLARLASPADS